MFLEGLLTLLMVVPFEGRVPSPSPPFYPNVYHKKGTAIEIGGTLLAFLFWWDVIELTDLAIDPSLLFGLPPFPFTNLGSMLSGGSPLYSNTVLHFRDTTNM